MRSSLSTACLVSILILTGACDAMRDAAVDARPVACAVDGGACPPGNLCVHVCDCCGADAGLPSSGHDTCVPDTGQCGGPFEVETRTCMCSGAGEAACPCA